MRPKIPIFTGMESKRQQKFAKVIQKELSDLFQREGNEWFPGSMVTITTIRSTPDLALARVHLSIMNPSGTSAQTTLQSIKAQTREIRYKLGKSMRNQVRVIPELEFFIDDTQAYVARMDELFEKIKQEDKGHQDV